LIERYLGFYFSNPFWLDQKIDVDSLRVSPDLFTAELSRIIFTHVGIGYTLKVCRDGRFLLRINSIAEQIEATYAEPNMSFGNHLSAWSEYLMFANAFALIFQSTHLEVSNFGYFESRELTNKDAFGIRVENGHEAGHSICPQSIAEKFQMGRYLSQLPNSGVPLSLDSRFSNRIVVEKSVIEKAVTKFDSIIGNRNAISNTNQLLKAVSEYKVGNFDTSLILAWFVVESIVHAKWSAWLDSKKLDGDGNLRINGDRKSVLKGRDYTMSSKLNMLELADVLPLSIFKNLDKVRGFRNKVVHQDERYDCSMEDAGLALESANALMLYHFNIALKLNLSLSISGL